MRHHHLIRFSSYLFDIFLGPSYNQAPPSVKYMTVGVKLVLGRTDYAEMKCFRQTGENSALILIYTQ